MFADLSLPSAIFLLLALGLALSFEFVNGFHDTANAVATVIYTHSLRPTVAVVWSGLWNLLGVLTSSGAVAFGVLALLPVELVLNVGSGAGFAMVFSLLLSAIVWNLGTWYFGLPASSSHTLIGSIMGVGLANAMLKNGSDFGEGVNWAKASEVGSSLLISPVVGFVSAALLLLAMKAAIRAPELYREPPAGMPPPKGIRALLILTCTGVSFAHGSNDGQKGMGLILLILVGIVPATYAVNTGLNETEIASLCASAGSVRGRLPQVSGGPENRGDAVKDLSMFLKTEGTANERTLPAVRVMVAEVEGLLRGKRSIGELTGKQRTDLRSDVYLMSESITKLVKQKRLEESLIDPLLRFQSELDTLTRYIPYWVKIAIALALGLGTMIGWQRIVVTVGEKIGKTHLSYAQGASAELVAAATIGVADSFGLPVSTTHVLSSGVAGTMAANRSGLQMQTLRNLLLAWVLTMPVCVFLGALLFALSLNLVAGLGLD
jgi:inorganic phosphate transporter, PiT family